MKKPRSAWRGVAPRACRVCKKKPGKRANRVEGAQLREEAKDKSLRKKRASSTPLRRASRKKGGKIQNTRQRWKPPLSMVDRKGRSEDYERGKKPLFIGEATERILLEEYVRVIGQRCVSTYRKRKEDRNGKREYRPRWGGNGPKGGRGEKEKCQKNFLRKDIFLSSRSVALLQPHRKKIWIGKKIMIMTFIVWYGRLKGEEDSGMKVKDVAY